MPASVDVPNYYFLEKDRKSSFKSWPFTERHECSITKMAEAGFYWCGTMQENDAAEYFLCGKQLDGWEPTDNPWSEHKKHSPQCAFVKLGHAEDDLTISEQLDLLELYVKKVFDKKLDDAMKALSDLGNKTRSTIQTKLKSNE